MENLSFSNSTEFDFKRECHLVDDLLQDYGEEVKATETRRKLRLYERDVEQMKQNGELAPHETLVVRRVIERNIVNEKSRRLGYIEGARNLLLFTDINNPTIDTAPLANWFSRGMRYQNWAVPWHRTVDATSCHGAGYIECRLDLTKPFQLALNYIPRDELYIPKDLRNSLQDAEMIARKLPMFPHQLEAAVRDMDFSAEVVHHLVSEKRLLQRTEPIAVYRILTKRAGVVYEYWYCQEYRNTWLREPQPLSFGVLNPETQEPIPLVTYPVFVCLNEFTEDQRILACKGRVFKDLPDQDALTMLWSAIVNGSWLAASINASVAASNMGAEGAQAQPIARNTISPQQLNYYQATYPDAVLLSVANGLMTENQSAAGDVNFAAVARKDSRKSATELQMADSMSNQLATVNIVPLASCMLEVYSFVWHQVRARVLYGGLEAPEALLPFFSADYALAPAGDVEVIRREEKIRSFQMDFPIVQGSAIFPEFLAKYIELRFPDEAPRWAQLLQSPLPQVAGMLLEVVKNFPTDGLPPEQQQQLQQIIQTAENAIATSTGVPPGPGVLAPATNNAGPAAGDGQ